MSWCQDGVVTDQQPPPPQWYPDLPAGPWPAPPTPWYRKKWGIAVTSVVAVLVIAGGVAVAVVVTTNHRSSAPTTSAAITIKAWWVGAGQDFADLQNAIGESQRVARLPVKTSADATRLEETCQRLHDAQNKLQSSLPSPDPALTTNVQGAIHDVEMAAHDCLATAQGALKQYGEFKADLDTASRQLQTAQDIVNNSLPQA